MIVLGNERFALAMRLSGVKECHTIREREEGIPIVRKLPKDAFILANVSVLEFLPELKEFENCVTLPDDVESFNRIDDLSTIIKEVIGTEIDI